MSAFRKSEAFAPDRRPGAYSMLVVEDDIDLASGLEMFFGGADFAVTVAHNGNEALQHLRSRPFDIVLLDVMMPGMDGFEVLRTTHQEGINSPMLMLTGKAEKESILTAFSLGAMDYVTKPFSADELAARVRAILNRTLPPSEKPMEVYHFGDVRVNFSTHEASRGDQDICLTALEFDVLRYLIQNRGRMVTRKQLLKDVWGIDNDITTRTIDRHVASLRRKIEPEDPTVSYIETIYGVGYRFSA